jgi:hypothetical protein
VPGSFSVKRFQEFLLFRQWKRFQPADSISASVLTVKKHHRLAFDCNEWLPFAFRSNGETSENQNRAGRKTPAGASAEFTA